MIMPLRWCTVHHGHHRRQWIASLNTRPTRRVLPKLRLHLKHRVVSPITTAAAKIIIIIITGATRISNGSMDPYVKRTSFPLSLSLSLKVWPSSWLTSWFEMRVMTDLSVGEKTDIEEFATYIDVWLKNLSHARKSLPWMFPKHNPFQSVRWRAFKYFTRPERMKGVSIEYAALLLLTSEVKIYSVTISLDLPTQTDIDKWLPRNKRELFMINSSTMSTPVEQRFFCYRFINLKTHCFWCYRITMAIRMERGRKVRQALLSPSKVMPMIRSSCSVSTNMTGNLWQWEEGEERSYRSQQGRSECVQCHSSTRSLRSMGPSRCRCTSRSCTDWSEVHTIFGQSPR